ncbi:MAG TPA: hypothetical protein VID50_10665 [Candidatus Eisenbacteria bacterium]
MKARPALLALAPALLLSLAPCRAPGGSAVPSSLALRWGVGVGLGASGTNQSFAPSLSTTWPVGRRVALWSCATYLRERSGPAVIVRPAAIPYGGGSVLGASSAPSGHQTRYFPLGFGLRAYADSDGGRPRGLFLEGGPGCTLAWYDARGGGTRLALLGGLQSGIGVRFPVFDGSNAEIGASYYLADAFGEHPDAAGSLGRRGAADLSVFVLYAGLGFGR